jgi:Tfp pilus assembly protein PilW
MNRLLSNQNGTTLIESIIVGVLSTVVGGAIFTVFFFYSNTSNRSISSFFLQQQCETVIEQITRDVRRASYVLPENETPATRGSGLDTVHTITLWNGSGEVFARYTIDGSTLFEGVNPKPFEAGGGAVKVAGVSGFVINQQRKGVSFSLSLSRTNLGQQVASAQRMDVMLCRN